MYLRYLNDPNFFKLLHKIDKDLAKEYRQKECPKCMGALHYANYWRKARFIVDKYLLRFSVCCSQCRSRVRIPSTLFFNSFVYGSIFFLIIGCFNNNGGHRYRRLAKIFKVSDRTLRRWKSWWDDKFLTSNFWKERKGLLTKPPDIIPLNIVQEFLSLYDVLKFFSHFNCSEVSSRNRC